MRETKEFNQIEYINNYIKKKYDRINLVVPAGSTVRCILQSNWQTTSARAVKTSSHAIVRWKNVNHDRQANC